MSDKKILVVEDNPMNLELVSDILEANGYQVIQAQEGRQALEMARAERPGLILMDIQLPEMDGLEVTRLLKSDPDTSGIVVVAITAHAMRGDEERVREAGCSGYIAKPINTRDFVNVIESHMESAGEPES
jgi:two-component system cell cycle response regulator DivK